MSTRDRKKLRVFISSPDDVQAERESARRVVHRLNREFQSSFDIDVVMWEWEPLLAHKHFQAQLTLPRNTDITLVILWSRLGSLLPMERFPGPITGRHVTGTEWEYEDALSGAREKQSPEVLLFRKQGAELLLRDDRPDDFAERQRQLDLVREFFDRWFLKPMDGSPNFAYHRFKTTSDFEDMLYEYLKALVKRRSSLGAAAARWHQGNPYLGLVPYGPEHAKIFFGRARASRELRDRLESRLARRKPILIVLGASGSGKSSLVKAGLVPDMVAGSWVGRIGLCRYSIFRPGDESAEPVVALARALLQPTAVPELLNRGIVNAASLEKLLRESPASAATMIEQSLREAARLNNLSTSQRAGLLIVVDQFEELFTSFAGVGSPQTRTSQIQFVAALEALALQITNSGQSDDAPPIMIVATMRSDFFDRLEGLPELARLTDGDGQYLLLPPDGREIAQMIKEPADAAGVHFERDEVRGIDLSEEIQAVAEKDPRVLPLLSFVLGQLWERRTSDGMLTFAAYKALGGLEGALAARAEQLLKGLPQDVSASLPNVLVELAQPVVGSTSDGIIDSFAARWAPSIRFPENSPERALIDAFLRHDVRLFVAEGDRQEARIRVTHETLLTFWPRAREQLVRDRRDLALRSRLEEEEGLWRQSEPHERAGRLLTSPLAISEAVDLAQRRGSSLAKPLLAFIKASADADRERRDKRLRLQRKLSGLFAGLFVFAAVLGVVAWHQRHVARDATAQAEDAARKAQTMAKEREWTLYISLIGQAQRELDADIPSPGRARDFLNACPRTLQDGWEWRFLDRRQRMYYQASDAARKNMLLSGHNGGVWSVAISPDGKSVASASSDGEVFIWSNWDQSPVKPKRIQCNLPYAMCVAFSPDGKKIAAGGFALDSEKLSGKQLARDILTAGRGLLEQGLTTNIARFSAITAAAAGRLVVFDLETNVRVDYPLFDSPVVSLAFRPDGKRVVAASWGSGAKPGALRIWNLGSPPSEYSVVDNTEHLRHVSFSPDSKYLALACMRGDTIIRDAESRAIIRTISGHKGPVMYSAFSPDSQFIASASMDGSIRVSEIASGNLIGNPLVGHTGPVMYVAYSPDGKRIATAGWDKTVKIWDPVSCRETLSLNGHNDLLNSVAFSGDGNTIVSGAGSLDMKVGIWTATELPRSDFSEISIRSHHNLVSAIAFSPDGRRVASGSYDTSVKVFDATTGAEQMTLQGHTQMLNSVAFSPDGKKLVSGGWDKAIFVWDLSTQQYIKAFRDHRQLVRAAEFIDDDTIVSGSADGVLKIWQISNSHILSDWNAHSLPIFDLAYHRPTNRIVTASGDTTAIVWDRSNGKQLQQLPGHRDLIWAVAFSPDGMLVGTAGYDKTVRVWDSQTGAVRFIFKKHTDHVMDLAFSPDSKLVASASADRYVRVWDALTGDEVKGATRIHSGPVMAVAFSPDGTRIASGGGHSTQGEVKIWSLKYSESKP